MTNCEPISEGGPHLSDVNHGVLSYSTVLFHLDKVGFLAWQSTQGGLNWEPSNSLITS